ncbi:pituitary tumor-transforming gene 1 protein-interacting protein [Bombina bombina]|uniref:pituitary tumor-transforming gene 1 protein-interacting protein n=1 Tax=Bombina bombina TaxID=8345 RepID=UPI00235A4A2D|nr:pituitary tumor-transforming gene 1 protein-interacting protein [Bombina bombina]
MERSALGVLCCVFSLVLLMADLGQSEDINCSSLSNTTCETCLKNVKCFWCNTESKCIEYPAQKIVPPSSLCKLNEARWGVCWVNFQALIITMAVVGGIIIISVLACCCFCCRKKKNRNKDKEDEKTIRQKEERQTRQEERRVQMKNRHDEIRKKYGLFKEDNPYTKFDA